MLAHVYRCAQRHVRRRGCPQPASDDDPLFDLNFLSNLRFASLDSYISRPSSAVVPIISARISLPETEGSVDLLDVLPPALAARYAQPSAELLRAASERPRAPRTRLAGSQPEWSALVRRLADRGMVEFTDRPIVHNGAFGTPKNDDTDRFIIDARPANTWFVEPPHTELPTPNLLAQLATDGGADLFVAKVDLDNFYHRIRLPAWLRPYMALPPVRAGDVGLADRYGGTDVLVYPCAVTLPMGWSHSVFLAQAAHEHILNTLTGLRRADRISAHTDPRVDRLRHQVYIDDLNLFGTDRAEVDAAQREYVAAIRALGLVVKQSKVVAASADGVECVGLEVHGRDHTVGLSGAKLARLCADTQALIAKREVTGLELAHVLGRWTWAALARRPALAVFNAAYRFVECAKSRRFTLWRSVVMELRTIVGLAPLLFADTAAAWFDRVVATDASSTGQGVAACVASQQEITLITDTPSAVAFVQRGRWSPIVSSRWARPEHINILELRAVTTAVRWALSFGHTVGRRMLIASDSQVVVGAVSKGRSSAQPMLRRLRYLAALLLGSGVQATLHWIPTDTNPADEWSRK